MEQEIEIKLREIQAGMIRSDAKNHSFSKIVNMVLLAGIMYSSKLEPKDWYVIKKLVRGRHFTLDEYTGMEYSSGMSAMHQFV